MKTKKMIVIAVVIVVFIVIILYKTNQSESERGFRLNRTGQSQSDDNISYSDIYFEVMDLRSFGTGTGKISDEYSEELGSLLNDYREDAPSTEGMTLSSLVLYRLDFLSRSEGFLCSVYVHQDSSFVFFGEKEKAERLKQILMSNLAQKNSKAESLVKSLSGLIPR
jgi:hypothetical protein